MKQNTTYELFLKLIRIGIGTEIVSNFKFQVPSPKEWVKLKALADEHGLTAIILDALNTDSSTDSSQVSTELTDAMPQQMKLEWIGEVMQSESTYKLQQEVAADMALLFHKNAMRTYVLKGAVIAECYPKPNHRASVDLDCFLLSTEGNFDAWELGNSLIESRRFDVSRSYYKNSTFHLPGLVVENHHFITPFRGDKRLSALEKLLQSLIKEDKGGDLFKGTYLYRPPIMVSALFIIEHAYNHFLSEGMTWKHILDWQMFSKKHQEEIDWSTFHGFVDEFGFRKFYDAFLRLGHYLMGELTKDDLNKEEKRMLADVWAPLDLHGSLHGVKAKFQLAGNYWRARWKYKYFTEMTWIRALMEWVFGAVFDRHPKLD